VKFEFNIIVYETLNMVAQKFLDEHEEILEENREFEIFTNYMDSHINFSDEDVQSKFEDYF
jgi:hypothetical protein